MKKILSFILLLSFFSCDKDEPDTLSAKYSKQEIFNAVVGTWKFSRLGYDPEFKRIKNVEAKPCTEFDRTTFKKDSTVFITFLEGCNNYAPDEIGNFYIKFGGNDPNGTYVVVHWGGFLLTQDLQSKAQFLFIVLQILLWFSLKLFIIQITGMKNFICIPNSNE